MTQVSMQDDEVVLDKGGARLYLDKQDAAETGRAILLLLGESSSEVSIHSDSPVQTQDLLALAMLVHRADPVNDTTLSLTHDASTLTSCTVCGGDVRSAPGGHGPTWVHADTGAVAAANPH